MAVSVWVALWRYMAPELWLTVVGFVIFIVDLIAPRLPKRLYGWLALLGFVGALGWLGWQVIALALTEVSVYQKGLAYWLTTTFAADPLAMFF